jgi:hypothetical protein
VFWNLLLAHFIADYPLQSSWMVRNKKHAWVIGLHSAIQLTAMGALLYPLSLQVWPALLAVAAVHFAIDFGKIELSRRKPKWVAWPYVLDQALHFAVLALAASWLSTYGTEALWLDPEWAIYATAFLVVTYVWFITERVLYFADEEYFREVLENFWGRMAARLALVCFSIAGWAGLAGAGATLGLALFFLYRSPVYRWRAILIDLAVSAAGVVFLWLALASEV